MSIRAIKNLSHPKPTLEGAGVRLQRAFGFGNTADYDPFLLFDDFRNDNPSDYLAGFPWHPHRGIETITYVLAGDVEHGDSLGNRGSLGAGDVQWMTAGSGILHQEMPHGDTSGRMHGFQLWANLPASLKMTDPRYQDVAGKDIPEITDDDGTAVRVVCGEFWGRRRGTRSRTSSMAKATSATRHSLAQCRRRWSGRMASTTRRWRARWGTDRWCCSIAAMKWSCRRERRGFASCSSPASRSRNPSPGMARS